MRVSTQLLIALSLTIGAVLGLYAYVELNEEARDLRATAVHDLRLFGHAARTAIELAPRDDLPDVVPALFGDLEAEEATVDVFVAAPDGRVIASSTTREPPGDDLRGLVAQAAKSGTSDARFTGQGDAERLWLALPLASTTADASRVLVLRRQLTDLRGDLAREARDTIVSTLVLLAAIALIAWLLFHLHVVAPLGRLVAGMNAVRAGVLGANVNVAGHNEIGEVLKVFNAMCGELGLARQRLTAEVESRNALEANLRHVDKLVSLGQLSAGLAHEIGSPLQILNGRARLLVQRAELPADVRRTAQILVDQSDRIARIVEQLVGFSRRRSAQLAPLDLHRIGRTVAELVQAEAVRQKIGFRFGADDDLPTVVGDSDRMQQVLLNLLTNAVKATPPGGAITVSVRADGALAGATPPADGPGRSVAIEVTDTGIGMGPEAQARAFEAFYSQWSTPSGSHRDAPTGAGLGLAVVKSIVNEHGGELALESAPGKGTRVTVRLPALSAARALEGPAHA